MSRRRYGTSLLMFNSIIISFVCCAHLLYLLMIVILLLIFDLGGVNYCGNSHSSPSGAIQSPNYPSAYPHEHKCTWFVSIEDSVEDIKVSFRYKQLLLVLSYDLGHQQTAIKIYSMFLEN